MHADPHERLRVLFVVASLAGGGAERIVTHLVRHIDRREFDARAGVLWRSGPYVRDISDHLLIVPKRMHGWISYGDRPRWWRLLPSLALVPLQQREIMRRFRPDVVVTVTKAMSLAARVSFAIRPRRRVTWIVREGNNTGAVIDHESGSAIIRRLQDLAVRGCYRRADAVVTISRGVAGGLLERFHLDPARIHTIYNALELERIRERAQQAVAPLCPEPFIVAAGRLDRQKGFDILLRAYAAHVRNLGVSLLILGEGRERTALEALARELGVADRVYMPGFVHNPWAYFARAAVFVCSSRWEGFGNVIVEALACEVPVISTDCDFGPREILRHAETGWLVPVGDVSALGDGMAGLITDRTTAARLAAAGARRARDFDAAAMAREYERLFRELAPVGRG